jgi:hypothetical protein
MKKSNRRGSNSDVSVCICLEQSCVGSIDMNMRNDPVVSLAIHIDPVRR